MQSARMMKAEGELHDIGRDMRSGGITGLHPTAEGFIFQLIPRAFGTLSAASLASKNLRLIRSMTACGNAPLRQVRSCRSSVSAF